MTNKEAKAILEFFRDNILNNLWFPNKLRKRLPEALDLAIKALEERPQGDLISRSELKKCAIPCQIHNGALTDLCVPLYQIDNASPVETSKVEYKAYNEGFKDGVEQGIKLSERPKGKWISQFDYSQQHKTMLSGYGNFWWCNKCDSSTEKKSNFCPNCGADMRGNK